MVTINIEKKHLFLISALIVFLAGVVLVASYTYNNLPANFVGHTAENVWINTSVGERNLQEAFSELEESINFPYGAINCPSTPDINTMPGGIADKPGYVAYTFPSSCFGNVGCIILQEVYDSKGLVAKKQFGYNQDSVTNNWWSSYQISGKYINGDTTNTHIIPRYGDHIKLDDDSGSERDYDKWTYIDTTTGYGMKIYICTYAADG